MLLNIEADRTILHSIFVLQSHTGVLFTRLWLKLLKSGLLINNPVNTLMELLFCKKLKSCEKISKGLLKKASQY